jgi:hypothetical protein
MFDLLWNGGMLKLEIRLQSVREIGEPRDNLAPRALFVVAPSVLPMNGVWLCVGSEARPEPEVMRDVAPQRNRGIVCPRIVPSAEPAMAKVFCRELNAIRKTMGLRPLAQPTECRTSPLEGIQKPQLMSSGLFHSDLY